MKVFNRTAARFLQREINSHARQQCLAQRSCSRWNSSSTAARNVAHSSTFTSWKTGQILMVVAAAIGSGYALGTFSKNGRSEVVDEPEYATVKEMEKVGH